MPDEVWLTNADHESVVSIGWRTKRCGVTAYDNRGLALDNRWPNSFPVFAQKSELEKAGIRLTNLR
jgi:hypothetical protein